jgi:hypothetical protein
MKVTRLLVVFLALLSILTGPPAGSTLTDDTLLDRSLKLSQKLGGSEQIYYLAELCNVSTKVQAPAEKIKQYALAVYHLSSTEQNSELRAVGEKNGAACLSYVDAPAAMELLSKIDFERRRPVEDEDPRYNAAEETFVNLLAKSKSPQVVDAITAKARYLGETGQYPYVGVAKVIASLAPSSKTRINILLNDAVTSYTTETGFRNRDEEFLRLFLSLRNSAIDKALAAQAATIFVERLKNDPISPRGDYYAEIHLIPSGEVLSFTDRSEAYRFWAFPQIQRLNPPLADRLRQEDPRLNGVTDKLRYVSGGFFQGDPMSPQASQQRFQWLQESLLDRVKECRDSNPAAALDVVQRLADSGSRIIGSSYVIPSLARSNRLAARIIYEKQLSQLEKLHNSIRRLQAMVALVPAAYHLGDTSEFEFLSAQAFDTGVRFYTTATADREQNREGFAELRDLITFTASQPVDILQTKVQILPDDWLKAYLWLYEAEGQARRNTPPAAATSSCPE